MQYLLTTLLAFDGKQAEPLVELAEGTPATEANISKLIALAEHDKALVRAGATWVLKRWHNDGVVYSSEAVARFVRLLAQESEWGSQLHLLQMLSELDIPKASSKTLKAVAANLVDGENKFVRAWAVSALARLADQHPTHRKAALDSLKRAEQSSAASVKVRVRMAYKRYPWTQGRGN